MTNQMGELSFDKLKLPEVLSGLRVYWNTKPQREKRFKSETTPQSEAEELTKIQRCAYASAGISTDTSPLANGPEVTGYSINTATNTENTEQREITTTPRDSYQSEIGASCFDIYMDEGRKSYADTFSSDVTEIESFTRAIIQIVNDIINIGTELNKMPTQ